MSSHLEGKLIAFFHQSSDLYGSDRILLQLAEGVQKAGGKAVVLLPDSGPLTEEFSARGIEFHTLPMLKLSRARFTFGGLFDLACEMMSALPAYDRVFGNRHVDLVHSNTIAVLGGALWACRRRIPLLWHVHEIIEHPWIAARIFPRLIRAMADHVVCNSNATCEWLLSVQPSLTKKTSVIWNGVQAPIYFDDVVVMDQRKAFRPGGVSLALGLVGRINRLKGHSLLMDAVDLLHDKGVVGFSVVFVGSPPRGQEVHLTQLKERIDRSPKREYVVLQGFSTDVWPTYAALDIVCVPSTEPESFGLVAAEAMAVGRPVVASRLGALCEVVVDGYTGFTFDPRDPNALAAALEKLLSDGALRSSMGGAGKERIDAEFSVDRMTQRFMKTYAEVSVKKK